jgi:hypothetical protein
MSEPIHFCKIKSCLATDQYDGLCAKHKIAKLQAEIGVLCQEIDDLNQYKDEQSAEINQPR